MSKLNDGNESDIRIRTRGPVLPASLSGGTQTDLPASKPISVPVSNASSKAKYNWLDPSFISDICSSGITPLVTNQIMVRLMCTHFLDATTIFNEQLDSLIFNENQSQGGIRIVLNTNFDPTTSDKMPAIVIKRGKQESSRLVMGDNGSLSSPDTSQYNYVRRIRGEHIFTVLSPADGQADALGMEVFDTLTTASPVLTDRFPFNDFQVTGITESQLLSEMGNRYGVIITVQYDYEYGWQVNIGDDLAPILTGVNVNPTFIEA